jgi:hypothetical protein
MKARWVAALFVILALLACAQVIAGQGHAPHDPHSPDNNWDIRATGAVTAAVERRQQHVAEAIRPHLTAAPKPAAYLEPLRLPGSQ